MNAAVGYFFYLIHGGGGGGGGGIVQHLNTFVQMLNKYDH